MEMQKTLFGFTFEDVQGDAVEIHNGGAAVELETKQLIAGQEITTVLYFDRRHVAAFKEMVKLLENACPHDNTLAEPVGFGETITICQDCQKEL